MDTETRVAMLHAVADGITRRFDDFVAAEESDTGQPHHVIAHAFVPRGAANFKIFADIIKNVPTEAFQMDTPDGRGALNYSIHKPKGVVGVISPWNAPFLLMTWKVGPALGSTRSRSTIACGRRTGPTCARRCASTMACCCSSR